MAKRLSEATAVGFEELQKELQGVMAGCNCVQEAAQRFVDILYRRFSGSLVLLRLFMTLPYAELPQEDQSFVDRKGLDTNTSHLIHAATPIFTLFGSRGARPEWNDRRSSAHFRCIPLASTAFVASLSMLSRQFGSVGFDLGLVDDGLLGRRVQGDQPERDGRIHIQPDGLCGALSILQGNENSSRAIGIGFSANTLYRTGNGSCILCLRSGCYAADLA